MVERPQGQAPLRFQCVGIVGASGATGIHLARELHARGVNVRCIARNDIRLRQRLGTLDVDVISADAREDASIRPALEGCDLIADAVGVPADSMHEHARVAGVLAEISRSHEARLVQISSFWSYLPIRRLPLDETHPRDGGPEAARWRREAEDILQEAGAAVVQLPDFYGPLVSQSTVQRAIEQALDESSFQWIGSTRTPRDAIFVPDAMRIVADLATHEQAYGERWLVPGSGPMSARELAEMLSRILERRVKARGAPVFLLKLLALFSRELRAFVPLAPHYARPVRYDGSKLRKLLGDVEHTPHQRALSLTARALQ